MSTTSANPVRTKRSPFELALIAILVCGSVVYASSVMVDRKAKVDAVSRKEAKEVARLSHEHAVYGALNRNDLPGLKSELARIPTADLKSSGAMRLGAYYGNIETVKILLDHGLDANGTSMSGSPLRTAAQWGFADIARLLLDRGAKPDSKGPGGSTPLILAARRGNLEIVRLLLDAGADINHISEPPPPVYRAGFAILAPDRSYNSLRRPRRSKAAEARIRGGTALMQAVQNGYGDIVKLLLDRGADVGLRTPEGVSAMKLAKQMGFADIERLLNDRSAKRERLSRVKTSANR